MAPTLLSLLQDNWNRQIGGKVGFPSFQRDGSIWQHDGETDGSSSKSGSKSDHQSDHSSSSSDDNKNSDNNPFGSGEGSTPSFPDNNSNTGGSDSKTSFTHSSAKSSSNLTKTRIVTVLPTLSGHQTISTTFSATPTSSSDTLSSMTFTTSSLSPSPTASQEGSVDAPAPPSSSHSRHILPLGSIIAIILGILFCITISAVIYVMTRPKLGKLRRLWRRSDPVTYPPYPFPNNESAFAQKEIGYGYAGSIYRPIYETSRSRPLSQSFASFRSFRFGGGAPSHQGSDGRFTQITPPLPVARKSTQSRSTSSRGRSSRGASSRALSYSSFSVPGPSALPRKDKSWYSNLASEHPVTIPPYNASMSRMELDVDNYAAFSHGFDQNRIASPSFVHSSMSSVALDRQTIVIPYRSSGQYLEDVSEQETVSSA